MANKHMKGCLFLLVFREMQPEMNNVKYNNNWQKQKNLVSSFGEDEGELRTFTHTVLSEGKWYNTWESELTTPSRTVEGVGTQLRSSV